MTPWAIVPLSTAIMMMACLASHLPAMAQGQPSLRPPMVGTGFVVDDSMLLTAAHNVHDCHQLNIGSDLIGMRPASIVQIDRGSDLAVLHADGPPLPPTLPLAHGPDALAPPLRVLGFPGESPSGHPIDADASLLNDRLRAGKSADPANVLWLHSDPVMAGWSGAPVLNKFGEIAGMVVALSPSQADSKAVLRDPPTGVVIASGVAPIRWLIRRAQLQAGSGTTPAPNDPLPSVVRVFCWR